MARSLPEEIIFYEIWSRLYVKYLIRLSVVCKRWLSLITKPGSINSFLARTSFNLQNNPTCPTSLVLSACKSLDLDNPTESLYLDNPTESLDLDNPTITVLHNIIDSSFSKCINLIDKKTENSSFCYIVDSVHGLVCFFYATRGECFLFLWNPVTNLFKAVLTPCHFSTVLVDSVLGYDLVNADIKILQIELLTSKDGEERSSLRLHPYSCNTETWKEIKDETLPIIKFKFVRGMKSRLDYAYVSFYGSATLLVAFDFHDEVFNQLPCWKPFLAEVGCDPNWVDCVRTVVYNDNCQNGVVIALDEIRGTWSQQYIVPNSLDDYRLQLNFRNGDNIVDDRQGNLLLFQDESCQLKNLINLEPMWRYHHVMPYTESLIHIKGMQELNIENVNKCFKNRELSNHENNKRSQKLNKKRKNEGEICWRRNGRLRQQEIEIE